MRLELLHTRESISESGALRRVVPSRMWWELGVA
jgi:hypothetical protein